MPKKTTRQEKLVRKSGLRGGFRKLNRNGLSGDRRVGTIL